MFDYLTIDDFRFILQAGWMTILLSVIAMICGTFIALFLAFGSMSKLWLFKYPAWGYIQLIRGSPLLMQTFFMYFGLPIVGIPLSIFNAAVSALIINTAAFMSEIIRGGILSISRNQWESADALGLSKYHSLRYVILPQAVRIMIPPSIGYMTNLIKNSSIASTIGLIELTRAGRIITERTGKGLVTFLLIGLIYFIICYPISQYAKRIERRVAH